MQLFIPVCALAFIAFSCKTSPNSDKNYEDLKGTNVFHLGLNPLPGSQYYYDISSESEIRMEVDDKKVKNQNKSNVGLSYNINKDSAGNIILNMQYDKIHVYNKSGDNETDIDAANAAYSTDLAERMLGTLKEARIALTITPVGEVQSMAGYKELGEKIVAGLNTTDINVKKMAQTQWDKLIGEGLIKKNIDQLFKMFPDSAVHVGDKWKLYSKQGGDFNFNVKNFFTLKEIDNDVAIIRSEGEIASDSIATDFGGYNNVSVNLSGHQEGEYKIETKTGMLISSKIIAKIEGTIQMMGREVPVVIKTTVKMDGRKIK